MNHPSILMSCNNLATNLVDQGKFAEAKALLERALNGKIKVLGEDHPSTLNAYDNMGTILSRQHKYKLADEMHTRALEGFEKTLGKEDRRTLSCMVNFAVLLERQRKFGKAKEMLIQVLKGREEALGKKHADTQYCVWRLTSLFRDLTVMEMTEWGIRDLGREWEEVLGPYGVHAELGIPSTENNHSVTKTDPWLGCLATKGISNISTEVNKLQVDLRGSISKSGSHLFDETSPTSLSTSNVPPAGDLIEYHVTSNVDEQLMLFVPFNRRVKVHSMHITSLLPSNDNDESIIRPSSIKLFKNTRNILGFEEADVLPDTQQFKIAETSWDEETSTTVLNLNFVKFQDVYSLVIFINGLSLAEDMEEGVFTRLDRLRIFGK